jgi:hypothetical protein
MNSKQQAIKEETLLKYESWPDGDYFVREPIDLEDTLGQGSNAWKHYRCHMKQAGRDPISFLSQSEVYARTGLTESQQYESGKILQAGRWWDSIPWTNDDGYRTSNTIVLSPWVNKIPDEDIHNIRGYGHRFLVGLDKTRRTLETYCAESLKLEGYMVCREMTQLLHRPVDDFATLSNEECKKALAHFKKLSLLIDDAIQDAVNGRRWTDPISRLSRTASDGPQHHGYLVPDTGTAKVPVSV